MWEEICITGARFFALPFSLHLIKKLQLTNLCGEIDPRIANIVNLEELDLSNNEISAIPFFIEELTKLTVLNVSKNYLKSIPEGVSKLLQLKNLNASSNRLTEIPRCIYNLKDLKKIDLSGNRIDRIDEKTYQLFDESTVLYLDACQFSEHDVSQIMKKCNQPSYKGPVIYVSIDDSKGRAERDNEEKDGVLNAAWREYLNEVQTNNPLNDVLSREMSLREEHERIARECICSTPRTAPAGQGGRSRIRRTLAPLLSLQSDNEENRHLADAVYETRMEEIESAQRRERERLICLADERERRLKEASSLSEVYHRLINVDKNRIQNWLRRVKDIYEYANNKELFSTIECQIVEYLKESDSNESLRETLYMVVEEADKTCGDRMALSILYLHFHHRLYTCRSNLQDWRTTFNLLINGSWTMATLETFARYKISTLRFIDEIEVYMGFLVKLKADLDIPINISEMIYFGISCITPQDLEDAKTFVLKNRYALSTYRNFLIEQDLWIDTLEHLFGDEVTEMRNKRQNVAEHVLQNDTPSGTDLEGSKRLIEAHEEYKNGLYSLTMRLLSELSPSKNTSEHHTERAQQVPVS